MERTVLLVDDERFIRNAIRRTLQHLDLVILEAENGKEGLTRMEQGGIDLLITDLEMPEMTGVDLLEALEAKGNSTPTIVITGGSRHKDLMTRLEDLVTRGRATKLGKPWGTEVLRNLVQEQLSK